MEMSIKLLPSLLKTYKVRASTRIQVHRNPEKNVARYQQTLRDIKTMTKCMYSFYLWCVYLIN